LTIRRGCFDSRSDRNGLKLGEQMPRQMVEDL
jgi:hypothetical protein